MIKMQIQSSDTGKLNNIYLFGGLYVKNKEYTILTLIIALFGEIYFYPFESQLKFLRG